MINKSYRRLELSDSYPCPVCRHGSIHALVLTDAFSCEFCRHILSADIGQQQVQLVDSLQAIAWYWDGHCWRLANRGSKDISSLVVLAASVFTVLPPSLVWIAGFIFPPLSSSSQITFPTVWALLTLLAHLSIVLWLIGEYYQVPFYVITKVRLLQRQLSTRH